MTLRRERHLLKGPERRELTMTTVRIIGPGRAGLSFAAALTAVGVEVRGPLGRGDDVSPAAAGVGVLLLTVPDQEIAGVALAVRPVRSTVVAHCSGALGLDVLAPHERVAALHPLVTLPDPAVGAARLGSGCYFALAGDRAGQGEEQRHQEATKTPPGKSHEHTFLPNWSGYSGRWVVYSFSGK